MAKRCSSHNQPIRHPTNAVPGVPGNIKYVFNDVGSGASEPIRTNVKAETSCCIRMANCFHENPSNVISVDGMSITECGVIMTNAKLAFPTRAATQATCFGNCERNAGGHDRRFSLKVVEGYLAVAELVEEIVWLRSSLRTHVDNMLRLGSRAATVGQAMKYLASL